MLCKCLCVKVGRRQHVPLQYAKGREQVESQQGQSN